MRLYHGDQTKLPPRLVSPKAMRETFAQHRVAFTIYRRHPYEPWPEAEFRPTDVPLAHGQTLEMLIATRPFQTEASGLREIRRLTPKGTQTAIVTSNRVVPVPRGGRPDVLQVVPGELLPACIATFRH